MTTSGTVATTRISTADFIGQATVMAGLRSSSLTPENLRQAKTYLFKYLSALANKGLNLWTIEHAALGVVPGKATYMLPTGTIDDLFLYYRRPTFANVAAQFTSSAGGTAANLIDNDISTYFQQNSANGSISYDFLQPVSVRYFNLMAFGQKYVSLTAQYSFDNTNWTTIETFNKVVSCPDAEWINFMITTPISARYFRILETGGETLAFRQLMFCTGGQDLVITRFNLDDYSNLVDKERPGRQPTSYWLDRQKDAPIIYPWPVPTYLQDQLFCFYHRQIQDVGTLSQEIEIPDRWFLAVQENFALKLMLLLPGADMSRYSMLKSEAMESMQAAESQERDRAPSQMLPNIGPYTR